MRKLKLSLSSGAQGINANQRDFGFADQLVRRWIAPAEPRWRVLRRELGSAQAPATNSRREAAFPSLVREKLMHEERLIGANNNNG